MFAMKLRFPTRLSLALLVCFMPLMLSVEAAGGAPPEPYKSSLTRWRAAGGQFRVWERAGVALDAKGALRLDPATAQSATDPYPAQGYNGRNFYNGGRFMVGEAVSPVTVASFPFTQAIASWNAETPPGTWVETQLRARTGGRWTKWYNMGVWASDNSVVERHSVDGQRDEDGSVSTDTLVLGAAGKGVTADAFQVKIRLFSVNSQALPALVSAAVAISTTPARPTTLAPGQPALWGKSVQVPECSQMVYKDGGEIWCSPTSISMLLSYWKADGAPCEGRVRASVSGVYDWAYDGHGNWPFNTAYVATQGLEGYVVRFANLAQAEPWIAAGVPVVISLGWGKGELTGAPIPSSGGHLAVLVGFDPNGNPIINDPAAGSNAEVQRTYKRAELERLWLEHSGGTVYLVYPSSRSLSLYPLSNMPSSALAE
ncbi:MAG TPA: peptidase C39 family protein [Chloroflexia bacterium]|nr:peptidase C39 family protein [Chloroflexia bacterium]